MKKGTKTSFSVTRTFTKRSLDLKIRLTLHVLLNNAENVTQNPKQSNHGTNIHAMVPFSSIGRFPESSKESGIKADPSRKTPMDIMTRKNGCEALMTFRLRLRMVHVVKPMESKATIPNKTKPSMMRLPM